jgi:hypothetical protein
VPCGEVRAPGIELDGWKLPGHGIGAQAKATSAEKGIGLGWKWEERIGNRGRSGKKYTRFEETLSVLESLSSSEDQAVGAGLSLVRLGLRKVTPQSE